MEWLDGNLELAYPFADYVVNPVTRLFADAQVVSTVPGALTLTTFDPQGLTNAKVIIKQGATVVLSTTTATVQTLTDWTVLSGIDSARGSSFQFILSSKALARFAFLSAPAAFSGSVVSTGLVGLQSINGLVGDVILDLPNYVQLTIDESATVTVATQDPIDRVDCSATDCEQVYSLNRLEPDKYGSVAISNDGCHRLVPHPADVHKLLIYNHCVPCLDCADVAILGDTFNAQADYYHQLGAIYHDQFNRYQKLVAVANTQIADAESRMDASTETGLLSVTGRAINRPYFTQLVLALVNSSAYQVQVDLTVDITDSDLAGTMSLVPDSAQIQRMLLHDKHFSVFPGFPGDFTLTLAPQEVVSLASEMHRAIVERGIPGDGFWDVSATITYISGPSPIPEPTIIVKQFVITLPPGEPTSGPAIT